MGEDGILSSNFITTEQRNPEMFTFPTRKNHFENREHRALGF